MYENFPLYNMEDKKRVSLTHERSYSVCPYPHPMKEGLYEIDHLHPDHLGHEQSIDERDLVLSTK